MIQNQSIGANETWTVTADGGELTYTELIRQEYSNMHFSAGTVEGHPVDTLYLRIEREGDHVLFVLLRPDEAAAIAWCMSGVVWSDLLAKLPEETNV